MTGRPRSELEAAHARLEREVRQLREELQDSEAERQLMLASNSWKITAPLRWMRALQSGERHRGDAATQAVPAAPALLTALPDSLRAGGDAGQQCTTNAVFRPLALDKALQDLVPLPSADGPAADTGDADEHSQDDQAPLARIGFIGDAELAQELAFDAVVRVLRPDRWREQLDGEPLDFVLIDTAWEPEGGWRYALLGEGEQARALSGLVEEARRRGVPSALWIRARPDDAARYAWLMPQVSAVYAADGETARKLARVETRRPVQVLAPAIQPRLHNPVRNYALRDAQEALADKVLFDGWWDLAGQAGANHVLQALGGGRLAVVDSQWHVGGVRLRDLPDWQDAMLGCLSASEKAMLSKLVPVEYLVESELTPRWRREQSALRAAACGAVVVTEPAVGDGPLAGLPSVVEAGSDPLGLVEATLADPLERMRTAHRGFREAMASHRLRARLIRIMQDLGLEAPAEPEPRVATVLVSMRPDRIADCLASFRAQDYPHRELIVVVHADASLEGIRRGLRAGERAIRLGKERSLGDCLNFALTQTDAPYWAKVDDDDHYGPAYLSDLMLYRHVSPAKVWGKPPMFLHSEAHDELAFDPVWGQHANLLHRSGEATSALVAGGTLAGRREVFDSVRFCSRRRGGSDSEFIRQCYAEGLDVLSTDGFNFVRFRSGQPGFHTWQAPSSELRERAHRLGSGSDVARFAFL